MGNNIKILRIQKGLSQEDLSKIIGVSQGTLSNWERGEFDIDNSAQITLADYFGVSLDFLMGRVDHPRDTLQNINVLKDMLGETKKSPTSEDAGEDEAADFGRQLFAMYGETPKEFDEDDLADIAAFMKIVDERKKRKEGK